MANLVTRPDTFLGICEAIGQDLRIHPNLLRIALAVTVLWQPAWAIAGYIAVGIPVLALRLLVPDRTPPPAPAAERIGSANDGEPHVLVRAA